jgi:hypothetical protein
LYYKFIEKEGHMPINIEIPDDFFNADEKANLNLMFGAANDKQFAEAVGKVVLAALDEYRDMFLGMGLPSRASEIREFRLFYLIKRFFNGRIPDELEVSNMFQLPESRSKNLILYVLSRFRFNLEEEILNTLRQIIAEAEKVSDGVEYRVFIGSKNMVDEFDRIIARAGVRFRRLTKIRGESNMYAIAPDSFNVIRRNLA